MRNDVLQLVFALPVLVLGAGCEELLPKCFGLGLPVLLTSVLFLATRTALPAAVLFAVAAGATEDAISALTPMTSVSYFLIAAAVVRWSGSPCGVAALACAGYQLWLAVWLGGVNVFSRILLAFPLGLLTACAVAGILAWAIRKAAIDELG
ncbi:MAG: hypothetical protein ACI4RD_07085 [Kiritimatiellia bacterium]